MDVPVRLEAQLIDHVPFCAPYWMPVNNVSMKGTEVSLWAQMPTECRSANVAAATVACILAVFCMVIHVTTMISYSKLRGDILQRKAASSARRMEKRKKLDLRVIKEAADYAFAMTTQERLRMTFAFTGLLSSIVSVPVTIASAGVAYSEPFPKSFVLPEKGWVKLRPYSVTISALFHVTLTASFCIFVLMMIERYREIRRIHPDSYIKSGKDESVGSFRRSNSERERRGTSKNQSTNWRGDPDVIPKRDQVKLGKMQDTFLYTFQKSYTFLDLVMALVVPLVSGIVATVVVAAFGGQFEIYGLPTATNLERQPSINGLISYAAGWFPNNIYMHGLTVGLLILISLILIPISLLKCHTLTSIAKYLPGYQHSRDLFKFLEAQHGEQKYQFQGTPRGGDEIRRGGVLRNPRVNRQDPDGLSIDEADYYESSMSSIPPPPASTNRASTLSLDNISLPPPPRPESMIEGPGKPLMSFPSLPSMIKFEEESIKEPYDNEITEVKAEAFFGNIRQTKVVVISFLLYLFLSAPTMVLFLMGALYSHDKEVTKVMGVSNTTYTDISKFAELHLSTTEQEAEGSAYFGTAPPNNTTKQSEMAWNDFVVTSANKKNWVTTLSVVFLIFYSVASVAPFFVYCVASRKFRLVASKLLCSCVSIRCDLLRRRQKRSKVEESPRTRTNIQLLNPAIRRGGSLKYTTNDASGSRNPSSLTRDMRFTTMQPHPIKLLKIPLRREISSSSVRSVSWGKTNHYGASKM